MTIAERENIATLIADNSGRIDAFDELQKKIDYAKRFAGNVYQVGAVTADGALLKISRPDIVAAMESEIAQYIIDRQAEQEAI